MVSTCPMCTFNIDHKQSDIKQKYLDFKPIPVSILPNCLESPWGSIIKLWDLNRMLLTLYPS